MLAVLKTYLKLEYKLISIYKDKVFVFEKGEEIHLAQIIKPIDDKNKNNIGIHSLKDATALFLEAKEIFKNIKFFDYILSSPVTPQSRVKFYEHIKEANFSIPINFCGIVKMKEKL